MRTEAGVGAVPKRMEPEVDRSLRKAVTVVFALSFVGAWVGVAVSYLVWTESAPWFAASIVGALAGAAAAWWTLAAGGRLPD